MTAEHDDRGAARRRAIDLAVVLVALGATAVYLRLCPTGLHPQIALFLYSIPSNSMVSVFSHEVALVDYGSHQPILLTTLSATLGTIAAGWLDWRIFVPLLDSNAVAQYRGNRVYRFCVEKFSKAPFAVLVLTGFTPVPFAPFKFLAFSVKYPLHRYLAALVCARAPRYLLVAWFGSAFEIPRWILIVLFLSVLCLAVLQQVRARTMMKWRGELQ